MAIRKHSKEYPPFRRGGVRLTDEEREKAMHTFLVAFADSANVRLSAAKAGVTRQTFYDWKERYPEFKAAYDEAEQDANDRIRNEIARRAMDGWTEDVYQGAKKVGTVRKYSDRLLELLARSRMPEFREKLDVTTQGTPLAYVNIIANPELAEYAARLAEASYIDASGTSESSEPDLSD